MDSATDSVFWAKLKTPKQANGIFKYENKI
jgi:hypothetical protein